MSSTITLDGQLSDWTRADRLDFGTMSVSGFKTYGRVENGSYHFAIESNDVPIGVMTTLWLSSDQNTETGYKIFGAYLGAEYKIEFESESNLPLGIRPKLYSVASDGTSTLVEDAVSFAFSEDGTAVELAIDKARIGNTSAVNTVIDVNDAYYLPDGYWRGEYTLKEETLPVRTDNTLKVGIVFSETSAKQYFSETAYSQLIMAVQNQATASGIPFDILTESDLTDLSKVVNYDTLVFPSFGFVEQDSLEAIESVLTAAVYKYGISLVAAGNFMTNDETGAALAGDPYARMKALLGVERLGGNNVSQVTVTATGDASATIIGYGEGDVIGTYLASENSQIGTAYFDGVSGGIKQILATQETAEDGIKSAVIATQTGANNVFFSTEGMLADSNMLQHAINWTARPEGPALKLQMGRQASIFAARNDMDQSLDAQDINDGIYDKLLPIVQQWKEEFDFVSSYYVNIGSDPASEQATDWSRLKPFYQKLLAMGNEIGTHSYTHPDDTNVLSPEEIEFEFRQSKLMLEEILGISITGAAVPGAPETLATSKLIGQYFSYISGGYTGVGAGYPGAFGYITPESDSVYLAPNMKFDFSLIEAEAQYGGGMTPEQAKQEWIREYNELSLKSDLPVIVWPWHDYGPTQWVINPGQPSPYTTEMYSEFLRYAHQQGAEFVTMADLAQRIKAFEKAGFNYRFDSIKNTITATVTANQIGTFALDVEAGKTIASVSGWYAYDNDSVFLDADGGTYNIKLGATPEDVTHITALPARAQLLSVTGDGTNLTFSIRGEGKISIDLTDPKGRLLTVTGAEIASRRGDKLELKVSGDGEHTVSVRLKPPALSVALAQDTGISINDGVTSNGVLNITGRISGAMVEYSLDRNTWGTAFSPIEGQNTVFLRQKDAAGTASEITTFSFVLDRAGPTASIELPPLNSNGTATATITLSEAIDPSSFTLQDLTVTGARIESLVAVGSSSHKAILTPHLSGAGKISLTVKNATYADISGNAGIGISQSVDITKTRPTNGADWLVGTNGKNTLKGGNGDDIIRGRNGNDVIIGGNGKDLLDLSDGSKAIKISLSQNNVKYSLFDGKRAGLGVDKYRDMEGVIGTKFADTITGSSSGDTLAGLGGNDILRGGSGNDIFVFEAKGGRDRVLDFEDTGRRHDKLDVRFFDFDVKSSSFAIWKESHVKQEGSHTVIKFDATTSVKLMNIKAKAIGFDDFLF